MLYHSSLELIGHTPLVELSHIKIPNNNRIFAKLEGANPAGGVKDRVALHILSKLKNEGKLTQDSIIIEATAGNTGLGIAFVALHFGVQATLIVPDKFSIEKQMLMRALGAEVINTPKSEGMQGAITLAQQMIKSNPNAISINQFENLENPRSHYLSTAHEIWEDMMAGHSALSDKSVILHSDFRLRTSSVRPQPSLESPDFSSQILECQGESLPKDSKPISESTPPLLHYFIAGAGSGGSFSGIARFLKEQDSRIKAVLCDPIGSIIGGGCEGCANIEGIGNSFIPATMDTSLIDKVIKIADDEAYMGVRLLASREGILVGISSGACLQACLKLAGEVKDSIIVTLFADDFSRYFSRNLIS